MIEKMLNKMEELRGNICAGIPCNGCDYNKDCYEGEHAENRAIDLCKKIVQEVAKEYGKDTNVRSNEWISVEERLPKDFRGVLITAIALNGTSYTEIGKWNGNQWFHGASNTRIDIAEVIAWMELPAPYQKGE